MFNKNKLSRSEKEEIKRKISFQQRVPIKKIKNRLYVTKDDEYLSCFKMGQKAIDLMSADEVYDFARSTETVFEALGLAKVQFLLLPVPFDLAPYKMAQKKNYDGLIVKEERLKKMLLNRDEHTTIDMYQKINDELKQIRLLKKYIDDQSYFVTRNMQRGKVANKHCYVICAIKEAYNETAASEAAKQIEEVLKTVAEDSRRCSENEMEKILIELYNPLRPEIYINA